jgi:Tol biopolymer transport system component
VQGANASQALWEIAADGTDLHPLLQGWNNIPSECCGQWTADGKYFVFQSGREVPFAARGGNGSNIWIRPEKAGPFRKMSHDPVQLTSGPLRFSAPLPTMDGNKVLVIGEQPRGELVRYDAKSRQFLPFLAGISASQVDFSRDGKWVTYVTFPDSLLWRSRADGNERLQLSYPPMEAALPRWSPDGTRIAFMGGRGRSMKIFLVSAAGGSPQELLPEQRTEADPTWSSDGNSLSFGRFPFMEIGASTPVAIQTVDLKTKQIYTVPGSEGMYSPRWSPDGRYLAAMSIESNKLMLFDSATRQWSQLADGSFAFPNWSHDGKYLYFEDFLPHAEVRRVEVPARRFESVAALKELRRPTDMAGFWSAPAFDGSPLVMRDTGNQEIYALDLRLP